MQDISESETKPPRKRGRWIIGLFILMVAAMAYVLWRWASFEPQWGFADGFQSPQMAAAQYTNKTVRGNLGGVPVAIPPHFAEYVEYDGDPGWGEKRKGPRPVRTQESKIRSFGFTVRYPDMVGRDNPERWVDYRNSKIGTTKWIRVGLLSGEFYNDLKSTDRLGKGWLKKDPKYWWRNYEKIDRNKHGLEVYSIAGMNPDDNKPYREHRAADDIFIKKNDAGEIITYIKCSNIEIPSAPCSHYFNLEPRMRSDLELSYRRGLLSEWKQIQENVTQTILGFAINRND